MRTMLVEIINKKPKINFKKALLKYFFIIQPSILFQTSEKKSHLNLHVEKADYVEN